MKRTETVGVRLSDGVKQKAGKYAKALCIPQSAFIRILVNLGLEQVELYFSGAELRTRQKRTHF
jgi:antitoxin component of RelBE/YafQ-DinJ toxin-antitoxin module